MIHANFLSSAEADDLVVHPVDTCLALLDKDRLKTAVPVARDVDGQGPIIALHRLALVACIIGIARLQHLGLLPNVLVNDTQGGHRCAVALRISPSVLENSFCCLSCAY